jgi:phosphohistidine phosphatase
MMHDVRIYLVRHGDAVPEEDAGSDRDRWLSGRGREAARVLGRLLREQSVSPDVILCSPLPRAVQTAELIAASLDYFGVISSRRCFEPSAQPRVGAGEIQMSGASVIVVSHEPMISSLGAFILGVTAFPQFRTAQCCAIEDGKPTWTARADVSRIQAYFVE